MAVSPRPGKLFLFAGLSCGVGRRCQVDCDCSDLFTSFFFLQLCGDGGDTEERHLASGTSVAETA